VGGRIFEIAASSPPSRHYATGVEGVVEIESDWTGRKRERMGMPLRVKVTELPHPSKPGLSGAPSKP
jgi:hypothetical protein